MLRFQRNGRKPELITIFFTSRHCLTQRSSHGRPQQHNTATQHNNNTSRRFGQKIPELMPQSLTLTGSIYPKLSLRDLDEKMTSAG